jgi:transposase
MIRIQFTPADIEALNYQRYHHPHPQVQQKMEVLYLKSQGLAHQEIRRLCHISKTTLTTYLRQYLEGGIDRLQQLHYQGQPSALNAHASSVEAYFREHPPQCVAEAQAKIHELTGIHRSPSQIRAFLKRLGMQRRKVGFVPGKSADPDKIAEQEAFREQKLDPLLVEAKAGRQAVFFVDAAHFVHTTYLGMLWCFTRVFIPSPSGRKRFNVLGAINAVTQEIITITNEAYINAESVCQLLRKLAALGLDIPITLVLDNARYQKCAVVFEFAEELGITLLYLPAYSPHLNLIERLWRFVRKECLYSKYYADFTAFKSAIAMVIDTAPVAKKAQLASLMALKFQSFKEVQILAA